MRLILKNKAIQYLFFEMLPSFIMGCIVFVFIMIMFQALHYTEFVLIHGVSILTVGQMLLYICIGFLPALLPMALLFSVLMTYGRLSQDSEIVALKACGYSMWSILAPAAFLASLVCLLSAQTSFQMAPWGNRKFEILISQLEQTKASATLREGTFSEGFYNLVVYSKKVDSSTGALENVFIFDERDPKSPLTVIAKQGTMTQYTDQNGNSVHLKLINGDIHRVAESHTKIRFGTFDLRLIDAAKGGTRSKSTQSLSMEEIRENLKNPNTKPEQKRDLQVEFHKRWAVSIACFVFSLLGVALGTTTNSRHQKNSGFVTSLIVVIAYWTIYVSFEGMARSGQLPVYLALWIPNTSFALFTGYRFYKNWN